MHDPADCNSHDSCENCGAPLPARQIRPVQEPVATMGYSVAEEIANSVTHGIGMALASAGLAVMVTLAALRGTTIHVVTCAIFGATMVVLYTASTLYHSIPHPRAKNVLRVLDHTAIYLLIAGTYTPFTLVSLRGPWGWWVFAIVWTTGLIGVTLGFLVKRKKGAVTATVSAIMGWTVIVAFKPLMENVETGGIILLILGGITYTAGIAFYGWKRFPWNHAVWHLFVLGGSVFHYFAVLFYVIPRPA